MSDRPPDRRTVGTSIAIGAGLMLCCAGPALVSAGVLGAIGAFLWEPTVLAIAGGLAVLAVGWVIWRRTHKTAGGADDCCAPTERPHR